MKSFLNKVKANRTHFLKVCGTRLETSKLSIWINAQECSWWINTLSCVVVITLVVTLYIPSYVYSIYKAIVSK